MFRHVTSLAVRALRRRKKAFFADDDVAFAQHMLDALRESKWQNDVGGAISINELDINAPKNTQAGMLHSPKGDFPFTVETIDTEARTFSLRTRKFGLHAFSWDGFNELSEKPADIFDRLSRRPPIIWARITDIALAAKVGAHLTPPEVKPSRPRAQMLALLKGSEWSHDGAALLVINDLEADGALGHPAMLRSQRAGDVPMEVIRIDAATSECARRKLRSVVDPSDTARSMRLAIRVLCAQVCTSLGQVWPTPVFLGRRGHAHREARGHL